MKRVLAAIGIVMILALPASACTSKPGTLTGSVTIGPIWPVEGPGETRPVPSEVFAARKIIVYEEKGKKIVKEVAVGQINMTSKGTYEVELRAGRYMVDINHVGIDRSSQVPVLIEVKPGETTVLNVDIDTGIR